MDERLKAYIEAVPKADLHVQIECTLELDLISRIVERNGFSSHATNGHTNGVTSGGSYDRWNGHGAVVVSNVHGNTKPRNQHSPQGNNFNGVRSGVEVLHCEEDFYDLLYGHLKRISIDNVHAAEIFFDPQAHLPREIPLGTVINGFHRAVLDGFRDFGVKSSLNMCFADSSTHFIARVLDEAKPFARFLSAVALECNGIATSSTVKRDVSLLFGKATQLGLKVVLYSSLESTEDLLYAIDHLKPLRILRVTSLFKQPQLVKKLAAEGITVELSNDEASNVRELLQDGINITVPSKSLYHLPSRTDCSEREIFSLVCNSFAATSLPEWDKDHYLSELKYYNVAMGYSAPPRAITVFGSRKPTPGTSDYKRAEHAGKVFGSQGFKIVCGGYSGVMEAVCKGARECSGDKISRQKLFPGSDLGGITTGIISPRVFPQSSISGNDYLSHFEVVNTLTKRIDQTIRGAEYFLAYSGSIGTMTELIMTWSVASARVEHKAVPQKIFLWRPAWESAMKTFTSDFGIYKNDVSLLTYVDSPEEALSIILKDLKERNELATL